MNLQDGVKHKLALMCTLRLARVISRFLLSCGDPVLEM